MHKIIDISNKSMDYRNSSKIFKNSGTSLYEITKNLLDSLNVQNDNTFKNYTSSKVSSDNVISYSSYDIYSYNINNSNTQNSSQTNINISSNSNLNNSINATNNLQYVDNLYQDNQSLTTIAHNIIKSNDNEIIDEIMINNHKVNNSHSLPPNSTDSKTVIPSTLKTLKRKLITYDIYTVKSIYSDSPNSYDVAISCNNKNHWISAIEFEVNNLYSNKVMAFVSKVPPGKSIISTKWVFATKKDSNNFIYKYKACLVAKYFRQKIGY